MEATVGRAQFGIGGALWALARPRLAPYVLLLPVAGYGWAHWDRALTARAGGPLLLVLASWALLHAGTLWLNAALDRDEGEVLLGDAVPVPPGIERFGRLALVGSVLLAALAHPLSGLAALLCAVLAVLYSHPRTVWKGHPVGGPLTNLLGYGLLSPLAGWVVVGTGPDLRTLVAWGLAASGVLGCYFAAQAFQQEEDAARGYRTLVATHGPRTTLGAARLFIALGWSGALVLAAAGWLPRICLIALPLGLWVDAFLRRWQREPDGGGERWARGLTRRMLSAGLLGLGLTFAGYVGECLRGGPVAGLATVAGHPPDRPLLAPTAMRAWERAQERNTGKP